MILPSLKRTISWHGILSNGQHTQDLFEGSKNQFSSYIKKHNITLLRWRWELRIESKRHLNKQLKYFTNTLADLLKKRIPLIDALILIQQRTRQPTSQHLTRTLVADLHQGNTLSQALAKHPNMFSEQYVALIQTGEQTQQLTHILQHLSQQLTFYSSVRDKLIKAMIYPACVLIFTFFITLGLIIFAIPQFQAIFSSFGAKLPPITQCIITLSNVLLHQKVALIFISIVLCITPWLAYRRSLRFKAVTQLLLLKTPWCSQLYRLQQLAQWCAMLQLCLSSKLPMIDSIQHANQSLSALPLKRRCQYHLANFASGIPLHQLLTPTRLMNHEECELIRLGMESHTLSETLQRMATEAHDILSFRLENLSKWLEPVIMLILALIAGGLIISMYLPIFQIGSRL